MSTQRTLTDAERAEARDLIEAFTSSGVYHVAGSADRMSDDALASWLDVRDAVAEPLLAKLGQAFLDADEVRAYNGKLLARNANLRDEYSKVRRDRDADRSALIRIRKALGLKGPTCLTAVLTEIARLRDLDAANVADRIRDLVHDRNRYRDAFTRVQRAVGEVTP